MNEELEIPCPHCRNGVILGAAVCAGCHANISYLKVWTPEYSAKFVRLCRIWRIAFFSYLALIAGFTIVSALHQSETIGVIIVLFLGLLVNCLFFIWLPDKLQLFKLLFNLLKVVFCGKAEFRDDLTRIRYSRFIQGKIESVSGRAPDYVHIGDFSFAVGGQSAKIKDTSTNDVRYIDFSTKTQQYCEVSVPGACESLAVPDLKL